MTEEFDKSRAMSPFPTYFGRCYYSQSTIVSTSCSWQSHHRPLWR